MTTEFIILHILPTQATHSVSKPGRSELEARYPSVKIMTWVPSQREAGWRGMLEPQLIFLDSGTSDRVWRAGMTAFNDYEWNLHHMAECWPNAIWIKP